jgi:hypothetical protein
MVFGPKGNIIGKAGGGQVFIERPLAEKRWQGRKSWKNTNCPAKSE